jgi:hypothetical protein
MPKRNAKKIEDINSMDVLESDDEPIEISKDIEIPIIVTQAKKTQVYDLGVTPRVKRLQKKVINLPKKPKIIEISQKDNPKKMILTIEFCHD